MNHVELAVMYGIIIALCIICGNEFVRMRRERGLVYASDVTILLALMALTVFLIVA